MKSHLMYRWNLYYKWLCSAEEVGTDEDRVFREDGYEVINGPRTTGNGYYESCIIGVEGNQIEITA